MNGEAPRRPEEIELPLVRCEVCLKEVPASGASAEGRDYVLYFCGTDCYQQWRDGEER
ncbi:DUF3330 domain-containing protein [Endothiovibrio diazotrophicus]